ncbi:glycosyltransferase [Anaerosacchariphilus sp. NSJ-68]|uniref:Glycosyltransferase n=2 Tax=Lachnospiraceae TaxID=186803 RepID=A0A923LAN8_9FIRM|nr:MULTISPECIES: glycosyltransferase [Lachnospiraceae]MBC5658715.1 glycosyltransferase [Anaerosacchariphilus hominis]MBC5699016.1 glycosyltransferase [Roseburia difficilis]
MKIVEINVVCGYGSTGRIVVDLYQDLEERGHECLIVYGRGNAAPTLNTVKIGSKWEVYTHVFLTRLLDKHGFGSKRATEKLIKKMKEYDPDLIHLHNLHGYYINIEVLFRYLKEENKPVIWTLHDCWAFTGHCAHFENIGCEKWKVQCERCKELNTYPKSKFRDRSSKNYKEKKSIFTGVNNLTIVTPSRWLANLVSQSYLKEYPVVIIPNGIDTTIFRKYSACEKENVKKQLLQKYKIPDNKPIAIGVASVWTKEKGLDDFISMANENPNLNYILVGVTSKIQKQLPSNITGILRTENLEELVQLYNIADVFLNPTYVDTYPTVNMEAKSCGLPVITYKTGGSVEMADVVVEKGDYSTMLREAMCINRQCIMHKEIDKYSCYKKYIELIEEKMR